MNTVIAIFLLLKAVSNGIKLPQRGGRTRSQFMGYAFVHFVLLVIHLWFGLWMLINP